jgi:DNA-directed RNA polymerase subunit RPC12/RpoP
MQYKCAECGMAVIVIPDEAPIKACTCEAAIIAEMEAEAIIHGGLSI